MKISQIDGFFRMLDEKLGKKAQVILIGAAAGALMGHVRPSADIDFEIRLDPPPEPEGERELAEIIRNVSAKVGLAIQNSEDISRWSFISLLDYRKTAVSYKRFGRIEVKLIAPECWTIGKMGRFMKLDILDILRIIRIKRLVPRRQIVVWGMAFKESLFSLDKGGFAKHVDYFIRHHGKSAWGKKFDADAALALFRKHAGIQAPFP